jgi:hypothetical protein
MQKQVKFRLAFVALAAIFMQIAGGWFFDARAMAAEAPPLPAIEEKPGEEPSREGPPDLDYLRAIERTAEMVWDDQAQDLAAAYGLRIVNVTWEDTGRYYGSAVGPNISDATIQVQYRDPGTGEYTLTLMPVIRYPNFTDQTADISSDRFFLLVGNEQGRDLEKISLREYLGDFRAHLTDPDSWRGRESSLLAPRDSHVLVSAQAAFLPIPESGTATFNPVLFNYQSYAGDPAVLAIVATREGTSATIIDNQRDGFEAGWSWGQRLFFNDDGLRASFTGKRLSEFSEEIGPGARETTEAARESGLNMVLLIQVPLKQRRPMRETTMLYSSAGAPEAMEMAKSDVEAAAIGHGEAEGPFTEIGGLPIERDERFPIRVTVQFYQATSNGIVSAADMQAIARQIERVYNEGDYVGSLVVDGPSDRPTEYDGPKDEPPGWWEEFWSRFEENLKMSRLEALKILRDLRYDAGRWFDWVTRD